MERPLTHYARSGELAIAYQVHGSGDKDLLFNHGTASNIETAWQLPEAVRLFERLGRFARVIRYDRRDTGLSDPIRDDLTLEAHADDALAVMEATGARLPVLVGSVDGARSLALLAATRPERVGGLIALAPTVRGAAAASGRFATMASQAVTDFADYPGRLVEAYAPSLAKDPARCDQVSRYFQTFVSPRQAARLLRMSMSSDISDALPLVQAPTLAIHARDSVMTSIDETREFAGMISGAVVREIPGDAAFMYALDVDLLADIIEEFATGTRPAPLTDRVLATVLFTDLVDSTKRAVGAGDRAWAETLDRHLTATRVAVATHGGETIKTTGDGVLALFTGPAQGVRCAEQVIADSEGLGLDVRTGVHTGEVERTRDDVAGCGRPPRCTHHEPCRRR